MTQEAALSDMFGPLDRSTLAEDIAARILTLIEQKRLQRGERLPSERELAATLGVSRPILREALRALSIMNVVEVRPGEGTYVSSLDPGLLVGHLGFVLGLDDSTFLQLFEVRKILEPGIAALAAERITDGQIEGLEECLQDGEDCLDDHDSFLQTDIELHTRITEAASNPLLMRFMVSLGELTRASRGRTVEIPGVAEESLNHHRRIVAALKRRDPDGARQAILQHLAGVEERLEQVVASAQEAKPKESI